MSTTRGLEERRVSMTIRRYSPLSIIARFMVKGNTCLEDQHQATITT